MLVRLWLIVVLVKLELLNTENKCGQTGGTLTTATPSEARRPSRSAVEAAVGDLAGTTGVRRSRAARPRRRRKTNCKNKEGRIYIRLFFIENARKLLGKLVRTMATYLCTQKSYRSGTVSHHKRWLLPFRERGGGLDTVNVTKIVNFYPFLRPFQ